MNHFFISLKNLFHLKGDTDFSGTVDLIKANIEFRSANAWTLAFAIVIASVGLNVNSTAVIIGAMLISPLMGPIVGTGYAMGVYDFDLLKKSLKNLSIAVAISIVASTIYFILSPLSVVQSELLARTQPSFYDVLIAFFGGAAGIVAVSRKEKGNAIPGVAIATALMPPLCTAGFGLATGHWSYFIGAIYLFLINGVFISVSTFIFVRYLEFPEVAHLDQFKQDRMKKFIASVAFIMIVPSFYMAWYLQKESRFISRVEEYIQNELKSQKIIVLDRQIQFGFKKRKANITVLGEAMESGEMKALIQRAQKYDIDFSELEIHPTLAVQNIEKKLVSQKDLLQVQINQFEKEIQSYKNIKSLSQSVTEELNTIFPGVQSIQILNLENDVYVAWRISPSKVEVKNVSNFLSKRLNTPPSQIQHLRKI